MELLRQSAAKAHDGKDAETIFRELTSWRNAHLPDPHAHPDRELRKLAESAVAKFQSERLPAEARPPRSPSDLWDDKGKPVRARFVEALMEEARFLTVRDNGDLFEDHRHLLSSFETDRIHPHLGGRDSEGFAVADICYSPGYFGYH